MFIYTNQDLFACQGGCLIKRSIQNDDYVLWPNVYATFILFPFHSFLILQTFTVVIGQAPGLPLAVSADLNPCDFQIKFRPQTSSAIT